MYIILNKDDERYETLKVFDIKEGYYNISNYGTIINKKNKICKPFTDKDGYSRIELVTNKGPKKFYIHRLVCAVFNGSHESKSIVNHIDSVRSNNYYENLEWVTPYENSKHALNHGFLTHNNTSEYRSLNTYSIEYIKSICFKISDNMSNVEILDEMDIKGKRNRHLIGNLIRDIRNKRSWKWMSDRYF